VGVLVGAYLLYRLWIILFVEQPYGPDTWLRFIISGTILGSVYAVIALGYTLVYGILFMINFLNSVKSFLLYFFFTPHLPSFILFYYSMHTLFS